MKVDYGKVIDRVKFWKRVIESAKDFVGTSPPALFVGRAWYPRVYVGILAPPTQQENADILDFPEKWYQQKASIDQILNFRGQLIYSRFRTSVKNPKGKLAEVTQELAMAKKPTDVEIRLKKSPRFKFTFNDWFAPIGNPAPVLEARLSENPVVERKVDYLVSDFDIKAQDAVVELYKHGLPISRIQKIFSAGLLGLPIQRKFVPTRWSLTAVDDILGRAMMEKIKTFQDLDEYFLFSNEYLANHFEILLIPGSYQYEFIEAWDLDKLQPTIASDYEPYRGRETYADNTHGAFYSSRLACCEALERMRRQAAVLVVREVRPEYTVPVGVWKIRETVRDAFNKPPEKFNSLEQAIRRVCEKLMIKDKWIRKSKLIRILREQKKIIQFWFKS
ncbi:MAG: hypothetical protein QMD12_02115 [Candidatus Aenigmarchaeota archaeon]|nr:hypothetical protein [Candidatus Aenigmarchaeota archaeon]